MKVTSQSKHTWVINKQTMKTNITSSAPCHHRSLTSPKGSPIPDPYLSKVLSAEVDIEEYPGIS
jgi:hypothetical protein